MPLFLNTPICPLYTHVLVTSLCIRLGYFCIHTVTGCLNNIDLYKAFPTRPPHCPDWSPPESSCPCDLSGMQRRYLTEGSVVFMLLPPLLPWPTSCRLSEHVFHQDCASYRGGNDLDVFHWLRSPVIETVTRDQNTALSVEHSFYQLTYQHLRKRERRKPNLCTVVPTPSRPVLPHWLWYRLPSLHQKVNNGSVGPFIWPCFRQMCAFVWTPTCLPPLSNNRYTQTCLPSPSYLPLFLFVDTLYFQGQTADESLATSWGPDKPLVCLDVEELFCNRLLFKCCLIQWWYEGGLGVELNCTQVYMYGTVCVITFVFWGTVHWRCSIRTKQC